MVFFKIVENGIMHRNNKYKYKYKYKFKYIYIYVCVYIYILVCEVCNNILQHAIVYCKY